MFLTPVGNPVDGKTENENTGDKFQFIYICFNLCLMLDKLQEN